METSLRPGELVIRSEKNSLVAKPFGDLAESILRYALTGGVNYVVPEAEGVYIAGQNARIEIIAGATQGELPPLLDGSTREAYIFLHGVPPSTPRSDRLETLERQQGLPRSVGECVLKLVDQGGWDEERAIAHLKAIYEKSVEEHRAYSEPWIAETKLILEGPEPEPPPEQPPWMRDLY
jgi:hypothetical protein